MQLQKQIEQEFLTAFKAKQELDLSVLRMLKSSLKNKEIEIKRELKDEEVLAVLKTEVKKRKDSADSFSAADRSDLADKELSEIKILEKFLPEQLDEGSIGSIVDEVLTTLSDEDKSNFGKVMGAVMQRVGGQADGGVVRKVLEEKLK
ncbi:GatB/YqeY domain-containing protein [Candidatus Falkowbacteria bacterium]|jgi:uncharacterized protein|nr:GatB/YqeY domain-containing protein [Candidatus Falkowbacteria bacterium]MBT7007709.1 GatB/YqeY domain-containing protein [Candidatus Falkowbacteria bacterium]